MSVTRVQSLESLFERRTPFQRRSESNMSCRVLITVVCLVAGAFVHAGDWPQWRGPGRNAVSSETGLLNQLVLDNKIMFAGSFPQVYKDHGGQIIFYVLKILGQSHKKAEAIIDYCMDIAAACVASYPYSFNERIMQKEKELIKEIATALKI